jgi:hypothetical protein
MSAADQMAVRMPSGRIKQVPRRVGLGMIARNQAKAAPQQNVRPVGVQGAGPSPGIAVTRATPAYRHPLEGVRESDLLPSFEAARGPIEYPNASDTVVDEAPTLEPLEDLPADVDPDDVPTVDAVLLPPEPRGNASRLVWAQYAQALGVEVTSAMTRNEIRDAAKDAATSLTRLPQPARTGGRLETPEDEPATETVAHESADPQ